MANEKISQLTDGNPAAIGDQIPINRGGANFSVTTESVAALAPSLIKTLTVTVLATDLNNIVATPVVLVPGIPGVYFSLITMLAQYNFVTTPYTVSGGGNMIPSVKRLSDGQNIWQGGIPFAGLLDQTANAIYDAGAGGAFGVNPALNTDAAGQPIVLTSNGEVSCTGGDGTLTIILQVIEYTLP